MAARVEEPRNRRQAERGVFGSIGALYAGKYAGCAMANCGSFSVPSARASRRTIKRAHRGDRGRSTRVELAAVSKKDDVDAVDELKAKGVGFAAQSRFWDRSASARGSASARCRAGRWGRVAVGIPCVIAASASQGLLSFWEKSQQ